jgi:alkanesulfonate monooxygenase SsuD/methylene tetrahydromethanopterin reductase-like flavin-dependent oxidoreductase (luciferase family)
VASGYRTDPDAFAQHWLQLRDLLADQGRDPAAFGNLVATLFTYVADDRRSAESVVRRQLAPAVGRAPAELIPRCAVGTAEQCAERIQAFADAGAQQIQLWPVADALAQIEAIAQLVLPALSRGTGS